MQLKKGKLYRLKKRIQSNDYSLPSGEFEFYVVLDNVVIGDKFLRINNEEKEAFLCLCGEQAKVMISGLNGFDVSTSEGYYFFAKGKKIWIESFESDFLEELK